MKIASKLYKELPQESTVIVLGDENLLRSSLSVLPEKSPWNVTMGYQNTLLTGLLDYILIYMKVLVKKDFTEN